MGSTRRQILCTGATFGGALCVLGTSAWAGTATAKESGAAAGKPITKVVKPTSYIAAYDTETPRCLEACRKIVEVHKRFKFPATFFIVGRTLESAPDAYRHLLDDPLFEIASHTYSHKMLRDHPMCGPVVPPDELKKQIFDSKATIE